MFMGAGPKMRSGRPGRWAARSETLGCDEHGPLLRPHKANNAKRAERRIQAKLTEGDFLAVVSLVILGSGQL